MIEILPERGPRVVELDVALTLLQVLLHLLAEWTHRAFTEDGERDALPEHALRPAVRDQRRLGVIEHVDEARRDRESRGIDLLPAARRRQIATGGDSIGLNRKVLDDAGGSRSVVDGAVPDDEVVLRRSGTPGARQHREQCEHTTYNAETAEHAEIIFTHMF